MKRMKSLFALMLAIMMLCCTGVTAFAQAAADASAPPVSIDASSGSEEQEADRVLDPLAKAQNITPDMLEESAALEQEQDKAAAGQQEPERDSNIPYFIGAGIAVLVFIGVAVFCKYKGTNNL